jgi:hypothetical protein
VALALARTLVELPQPGLRNDRLAALEQWDQSHEEAFASELSYGMATLATVRPPTTFTSQG